MAASIGRVAEVVRPAAGGIRRHVSDLLEYLDRGRFVPSLFAPADFVPDRPLPDLLRRSIEIGAKTHPLQDYHASLQLAQLLVSNIDFVHAHGLRGAIVGGFAAQRAHLPYLFTVHNLLPGMNFLQAAVFRQLAGKATRVLAVSEAVAQTLRQNGVDARKIVVIPNGVDLSRFDPQTDTTALRSELNLSTDEHIVLSVGRLSPEKGFDVLMEAFTALQMRQPDVRLLLVGDGPDTALLKAQSVNLGDRVRFLGHRTDTAALYRLADLVVAPSRQEGQGIVPLEAMATGRAVIASRVGGLVETIREGETGLLVPVDDAPALAEAIETLLNDPARRTAMGLAGRQRVRQEYTLQAQIERTEAIYTDVFRRTA